MMKQRSLHIIVLTFLFLHLGGVAGFSGTSDCDMQCCETPDRESAQSFYKAHSCCPTEGVTCGFMSGLPEGSLGEILTVSTNRGAFKDCPAVFSTPAGFSPLPHPFNGTISLHFTVSPKKVPVYIINTALIC